jgi:hypothetical protein
MHRRRLTSNEQWNTALSKQDEMIMDHLVSQKRLFSIASPALAAHVDRTHAHQKIRRES